MLHKGLEENKNNVKFNSSTIKIRTMETHNIVPQELLEEILSRLPVKHLLRLRCVNKSWCALIDSNNFIKKQHQVQYAIAKEEGDIPFFLDRPSVFGDLEPVEFYLLSKKQPQDSVLCLTPDFCRDSAPLFDDRDVFNTLSCMGVVNGVVGIYWKFKDIGLWNPATREFKVVQPPKPRWPLNVRVFLGGTLALGFDPKSDDFKIVGSMFWDDSRENGVYEKIYIYHLYSLSTNSWKSLEEPLSNLQVDFSMTDSYFSGVYYWTAFELERRSTYQVRRYLIVSFDFNTEAFKLFNPPSAAIMTGDNWSWNVGQYMEQFALIFSRENISEVVYNEFEIWVVSRFDAKDSGTPLSWQHLFTVGPIPEILGLRPKAFRMDGDLLLMIHSEDYQHLEESDEDLEESDEEYKFNEGCLYNPTTRSFNMLGFAFSSCYRYVESLFPLSERPKKGLCSS